MTGQHRVVVKIDRLVLKGVPASARAKVSAEVRSSIVAALGSLDGSGASAAALPRVSASVPHGDPGSIPAKAGAAVAGAVRRALNGGRT